MKHSIDWSKSHNGLMLCSFDEAIRLMPEVAPILAELEPLLELPVEDYVVDVKIHMLMPEQFPCIPNYHYDFRARDEDGERTQDKPSPHKMYMWLSGTPLTLYKDRQGNEFTKPAQQWHSFTQADLHRGQKCEEHTWRCFIRVIPKSFVHSTTKNVGTIRRHTQVYCDSRKFKW